MSVTMARADGVTMLTLTADPQSPCPPLCQVLKGLCCSPYCCSVSQHLRRVQRTSQSVLGALHIMVGLLNIGLGAILCNNRAGSSRWDIIDRTGIPFWLGGLLIFIGIMSILSEKRPSPCLITLNIIMNLAGVGLAITASLFYGFNLANVWRWWWWQDLCDFDYYNSQYETPRPSPHEDIMKEKCLEGKELIMMLVRSMNAVLIGLSVLELCVTISSVVMGIKALCSREKTDNKKI